ncbi:MAG: alpha/beta fold hydrolase, partial [Chitinophagaceae bacterium]
ILCFHGYAEDGRVYSFLEEKAGDQFSFYAIDLPFHGQTQWKESTPFHPVDLVAICDLIIQDRSIKFGIMGFSLGGRIALGLFERIPDRVQQLLLMAPDGLKVNFWYWLSTQTYLGNQIFAVSMRRPAWFFALLKLGNKLGLVNASIFKFVNYYIGNPRARESLYQRWTGLKNFRPDLSKVKNHILRHGVKTELLYGRHDRIILPGRGQKFKKRIGELCNISIIDSGHQVLHLNHVKDLLKALRG